MGLGRWEGAVLYDVVLTLHHHGNQASCSHSIPSQSHSIPAQPHSIPAQFHSCTVSFQVLLILLPPKHFCLLCSTYHQPVQVPSQGLHPGWVPSQGLHPGQLNSLRTSAISGMAVMSVFKYLSTQGRCTKILHSEIFSNHLYCKECDCHLKT